MPSVKKFRTNRCCFTLNNYTEEECQSLKTSLTSVVNHIHYSIVGKEVGASGTPHLQGYIRLKPSFLLAKNGIISKWKSLFPALHRAHLEPAFGSDLDSEKYCSKDENLIFQHGQPDDSKSQDVFTSILSCKTLDEIAELDPQFAAKNYFQAVAISRANSIGATKPSPPPFLKKWQLVALKKLIKQCRRKITFVVDEQGNSGKSVLAHFIAGHLSPKEVFYCRGGKSADIVHAFSKCALTCKYVIFDYARNKQPDFFAWDLIEELKDGGITSLKYDGNCFWVDNSIKIIVLTNHDLDNHRHRLTEDRWDILRLRDASKEPTDIRPEDHPIICEAFNIPLPEDPPQITEVEPVDEFPDFDLESFISQYQININ